MKKINFLLVVYIICEVCGILWGGGNASSQSRKQCARGEEICVYGGTVNGT